MIDAYLAYFLGILTLLVPLLIMYVLNLNFVGVNNAWQGLFCNTIIS
jgi:hypothetical protein